VWNSGVEEVLGSNHLAGNLAGSGGLSGATTTEEARRRQQQQTGWEAAELVRSQWIQWWWWWWWQCCDRRQTQRCTQQQKTQLQTAIESNGNRQMETGMEAAHSRCSSNADMRHVTVRQTSGVCDAV